MGLSTHILDLQRGKPAAGVSVSLARLEPSGWLAIGSGFTDSDGRCSTLLGQGELISGFYRLRFEVAPFFAERAESSLYPFIEITIEVRSPEQHHHVPLLLSANGYTTYRGS